jgi:hypothetical protein
MDGMDLIPPPEWGEVRRGAGIERNIKSLLFLAGFSFICKEFLVFTCNTRL